MSFDFPTNWKQLSLEDSLEALIDYRGKTPHKTDKGIPLVTAKVVKSGQILPMSEFIANEDYDSWMVRGFPQVGDIVITTEAPLGEVAQIKDANVALAQRVVTLRGKNGVLNNDYLLFLMQSHFIQDQLEARATGSTVKGIKQSELRKIIVPLPPLEEQKKIGGILKSLDNKIHLNNQINQTLESIAQAIFKSWFVDFEPVKAKIQAKLENKDPELAAMCTISGKSEAELQQMAKEDFEELQAIAALFPDELVESELVDVPKGWKIGKLKDIIDFNPKRTLKKDSLALYLDMKNVPTQGHLVGDVILRNMSSGTKFTNGDTLLARITPCLENGKTAYVDFLSKDEVGWGSTEFIVLRPKEFLPTSLGYFLARQESFRALAIQSMTGTSGRQRANVDTLASQMWLIYPKDIVILFDKYASQYLKQAKVNSQQNKVLENLRDSLLPKLLSGEIDVSVLQGLIHD